MCVQALVRCTIIAVSSYLRITDSWVFCSPCNDIVSDVALLPSYHCKLCSQAVFPRVLALEMAVFQLAEVGCQGLSGSCVLSVAGIHQVSPSQPLDETPAASTCCHLSGGECGHSLAPGPACGRTLSSTTSWICGRSHSTVPSDHLLTKVQRCVRHNTYVCCMLCIINMHILTCILCVYR